MRPHTLVIAEAGVNHNGSTDLAFRLVDEAAAAGADVVKFQTFRAERLVTGAAPKAEYQQRTDGAGESQLAMVKRLEIDEAAHRALLARCEQRGIELMSTPFDLESVELLVRLGLGRLKISSGDVTNLPLLRAIGRTGLPAILSTGMSTLADVEGALGALASGYLGGGKPLTPAAAFLHAEGQAVLRAKVTVLHCTTEYPAPLDEVNLRVMATLSAAFGLPVGYSDHTEGIAIPIAAVAMGAVVIEKHFTTDRRLPGPDHQASLEPGELTAMVAGIRAVERALGGHVKLPAPAERKNAEVARRSLVAVAPIRKGEVFTETNLGAKRPGTGISPMEWDRWIGRVATRDYAPDDVLER